MRSRLAVAIATAMAMLPAFAYGAGPDNCSLLSGSTNEVRCSGNQSQGIASGDSTLFGGGTLNTPPVTSLYVQSLNQNIAPAAGTAGIAFDSESGSNLYLQTDNSGSISTVGDGAQGVRVNAFGTPTNVLNFGFVLPIGPGGNGGTAYVNNHANITTDGNNAIGINAQSRAGGYPDAAVQTLNQFLSGNWNGSFNVTAVEGVPGNVGVAVAGDQGGAITINADGSFSYSLTDPAFTNLALGASIDTKVEFDVASVHGFLPGSSATVILRVTRTANGLEVVPGTFFSAFGSNPINAPELYTGATVASAANLRPDFDGYAARLVADTAVSGNGNAVNVYNYGNIETLANTSLGQGAYGIFAQSKGGQGLNGSSGAFGGDSGDPGGIGGSVYVQNHGDIHTHGDGAHGIVGNSLGGNGGNGGGSSFAGSGGGGGWGNQGGIVTIDNQADITTEGFNAVGIFAQSVGGTGGGGGGGGPIGGGGGSGGGSVVNDTVTVSNTGTITTYGAESHGILAQNIGGFGGSGGGATGIVALGSSGGSAGAGGDVYIYNDGAINTNNQHAHAIFAQSIGGGGGSAGSAGGLVALGGDGNAGGNGGYVYVNSSLALQALGAGSRGIFAQSIGGGGGDGGDSVGLGALGGSGAATSDGGEVFVVAYESITSTSHAIFAESIGGGGGSGGSSTGWISVGGDGAGGGDGQQVTVLNHASLSTTEKDASAIFAQSVGGGGGNGGNAVSAGLYASVSVGGLGGPGGDGEKVFVVSDTGAIETGRDYQQGVLAGQTRCGAGATGATIADRTHCGDNAHGIFAQSVGGGGGNAGFAISAAIGVEGSLAVSIGRDGGGGGDGDEVEVQSQSDISTHGNDAHGIFAQSLGGGGGNGGFAVAGSAANTLAVALAVGGKGGAGGDGGTVTLTTVNGTIITEGDRSNGILAQSIGGGGGNGGFAVAGTINVDPTISGGIAVGLGGKGGSGGAGDAVSVTTGASIYTYGEEANGIFAQSVGGGGGTGGFSFAGNVGGPGSKNLAVSLGGDGGPGSNAGTVFVDADGFIETHGRAAHGIFAQSVGGGGGRGGMAIAANLGLGGNNVNIGVTLGGNGGSGSVGKDVTVLNDGDISTYGLGAFGVYAQSVGGGGGNGGAAYTGNASITGGQANQTNVNVGFAMGGTGGNGNASGNVIVTNEGRIETWADMSHGVYAQAVGGGGGQGGSARTMSIVLGPTPPCALCTPNNASFNLSMGGSGGGGADGGLVTITNTDDIITHGFDAHGIYAQSVGAGGGSGGEGAHGFFGVPTIGIDKTPPYANVSVSMGGNAGSSGSAKKVKVDQSGDILTLQDGSFGILAQSVGGGGGVGGVGSIGFTGTVGVGGAGGSAGDGGEVEVDVSGNIDTFGVAAYGVFAQSVGGGGGMAGDIDRGLPDYINFGIGLGITRNAGNAGDGGKIDIHGDGYIHTRGNGATAIFAQSVGGGGGLAGGVAIGPAWAGSAGGNGAGGEVIVNWTGTILTEGEGAHGIFAQSGGGTATNVDILDANGNVVGVLTNRQNIGKDVNVTVNGNVTAVGLGSNAIFLQSRGADANGDISLDILGGTIQGGTGTAKTISIVDGKDNRIDNAGTITTSLGYRGIAILGGSGKEIVRNTGSLIGDVDLGSNTNALENQATGIFDMGGSVILGAGNPLTNSGALQPGGMNLVHTSNLTGNLVETGTSAFNIDVDRASALADRLNVSGTAALDGVVYVNEVNPGSASPGNRQYTVLSASGGTSNPDLGLLYAPSVVNEYELLYPNANDVVLSITTDFTPPALAQAMTANQIAIGRHINQIQTQGSAAFTPVAAQIMVQPNAASLSAMYDSLSPEHYTKTQSATAASNLRFSNAMLSCRVREGGMRFVQEGECMWTQVLGRETRRDGTRDAPGSTEKAGELSAGLQKALNENWYGGFALSYEDTRLDVGSNSDSDGKRYQAGLMLKGVYGGTTVALGLTAGVGSYDTRRKHLPVPGVAQGEQDITLVSTHMRVAHAFDYQTWYLRPGLALNATYLHSDAFEEEGAAGANLHVRSRNEVFLNLQPSIEVGREYQQEDGTLIRPYATLGLTRYLTGTTPEITASFEGAPAGVEAFKIRGEMDKTYVELNLGIDMISTKGKNLRLSYIGQMSEHTRTNGFAFKFSVPF